MALPLPKDSSHEPAIAFLEQRDPVHDVSPEVVIIALRDDPAILVLGELGAAGATQRDIEQQGICQKAFIGAMTARFLDPFFDLMCFHPFFNSIGL